jgi:hypothetical protein
MMVRQVVWLLGVGLSVVGGCQYVAALAPAATPAVLVAPATPLAADWTALEQRPLRLPVLTIGTPCPVSPVAAVGRFRALGTGPIYLVSDSPLRYGGSAEVDGWRVQKAPWLSAPTFRSYALLRGRRLDGPEGLRFQRGGTEATGLLPELRFPVATGISSPDLDPGWRFQSGELGFQAPGCYGVQIDGPDLAATIVFEATAG